MKIKPLEEWIGDDEAISYVAIRSDESSRKGYVSTKPNIKAVFPFIEDGVDHEGVMRILEDAGVGLPEYYSWRTRSGCYFCFFQRKAEWVGLAERHPDLFERAVNIERKVLTDATGDPGADFSDLAMTGRAYTWSQGESLPELLARRDEIMARHEISLAQATKRRKNIPLVDALAEALDEDDDSLPCTACHL